MRIFLFALLSLLCVLRIPAVLKVREARSSWFASVAGLIALYVLGTITPLETIDGYLGGINITNLLQSIFALLAIFFLNDSVRQLAGDSVTRWTYYAPLLAIPVMISCFAFISGKGPTAPDFIVPRMDQPATAAYSGTYMVALFFTVLRVIYLLRQPKNRIFITFSAGMLVVAAACLCHIAYVVLFQFAPLQALARSIGGWFDRLFYVGLTVTALGWLILFLSKQIPRLRLWLQDAMWLTTMRIRYRTDRTRLRPLWDLCNETLENGAYKGVISLHNYERATQEELPEKDQRRIFPIEAKLDRES